MRWPLANALALMAGCLGWCVPSPALAYEDQFTLGVGLGYAHLVDHGAHLPGLGADASASIGIGEAWALRAHAGYSGHPGAGGTSVLGGGGGGELVYLVDILEFVPYVGLGAGGLASAVRGRAHVEPSVHGVMGCDYLVSRDVAIELDLRAAMALPGLPDRVRFTAVLAAVFLFDR